MANAPTVWVQPLAQPEPGAGEFKSAIEVIRRGEEDKEIIVPLTGEMPKPRRTAAEEASPVQTHTPESASGEKKAGDVSSIPLE